MVQQVCSSRPVCWWTRAAELVSAEWMWKSAADLADRHPADRWDFQV
jgi:hypothetical protein